MNVPDCIVESESYTNGRVAGKLENKEVSCFGTRNEKDVLALT